MKANFGAYIDVLFIGVFCYLSGGITSDIYILYFFIIGLYITNSEKSMSIIFMVFTSFTYALSCYLSTLVGPDSFSTARLFMRIMFLVLASIGISNINHRVKKFDELHKKEFKLARTDKLTGLANRHYFEQKLAESLAHSDSTGMPINIILFDLDNFKKFNDSYGHTWGDKLLSLFSDIVKQNIRGTDIPVRYGGEEFLLLIRDLDIETARGIGERIRKHLEKQRIFVGEGENRKKVTVSCGVAQYPKHAKNIKDVIDCADKALYHAKKIGKNIVVSYDEIENEHIDISSYKSK